MLSDHERRVLADIEQRFTREDPGLAAREHRRQRARRVGPAICLALGILLGLFLTALG